VWAELRRSSPRANAKYCLCATPDGPNVRTVGSGLHAAQSLPNHETATDGRQEYTIPRPMCPYPQHVLMKSNVHMLFSLQYQSFPSNNSICPMRSYPCNKASTSGSVATLPPPFAEQNVRSNALSMPSAFGVFGRQTTERAGRSRPSVEGLLIEEMKKRP
jgi:hypothetical protein